MIPVLIQQDVDPCTTQEIGIIISRKEKQKKIVFKNSTNICVKIIQVDTCIKKLADFSKADYAFVVGQAVWYVELKASKGSHALEQLGNTVKAFKNLHAKYSKTCVLTCAIPAHGGNAALRQKNFQKTYKATLLARSRPIITLP